MLSVTLGVIIINDSVQLHSLPGSSLRTRHKEEIIRRQATLPNKQKPVLPVIPLPPREPLELGDRLLRFDVFGAAQYWKAK